MPGCGSFYDTVDLREAFRRGFRLSRYEALPFDASERASAEDPVLEAVLIDAAGTDVGSDLPRATGIRIRPPVVAGRSIGPRRCTAGYRLTITLIGPTGIDPFGYLRGRGPGG